jgi:hypothetical protein
MGGHNYYEKDFIIQLEEDGDIDPYDAGFMKGFLEA